MEITETSKIWSDLINDRTIRTTLLEYQDADIGLRAPYKPCGIVFRSSGSTHIYSGPGSIFMNDLGDVLFDFHLISTNAVEEHHFVDGIENFTINGKFFNPDVYSGDKRVITVSKDVDLSMLGLIGPETSAPPGGGPLVGVVDLLSVFEPVEVFKASEEDDDVPSSMEPMLGMEQVILSFEEDIV